MTGEHIVELRRGVVEVPEVWREDLEYGVVVAISGDGGFFEIWPTLEHHKSVTAVTDHHDERQAKMLWRFFAVRSANATLDEHGRLEIAAFILDIVGLAATGAVRMVGVGTHVECHGFQRFPETPPPATRR